MIVNNQNMVKLSISPFLNVNVATIFRDKQIVGLWALNAYFNTKSMSFDEIFVRQSLLDVPESESG